MIDVSDRAKLLVVVRRAEDPRSHHSRSRNLSGPGCFVVEASGPLGTWAPTVLGPVPKENKRRDDRTGARAASARIILHLLQPQGTGRRVGLFSVDRQRRPGEGKTG